MGEQSAIPGFGRTEEDFSRVDVHRLVQALLGVLPAASVLHDPEDLHPYECDGMAALRQLPLVVVLPETEAQVVAILRICADQRVPVVARGAGTGLSGGAQPHRFGVVLSLARLNRIIAIDAHAIMLELAEHARESFALHAEIGRNQGFFAWQDKRPAAAFTERKQKAGDALLGGYKADALDMLLQTQDLRSE